MFFKKKNKVRITQILLLAITGLVLGFIMVTQARYYVSYVSTTGRDSGENIFREIQRLKIGNDELSDEIETLEEQLEELSNQALALESIEREIDKDRIIAGEVDIWGSGIKFELISPVNEIWFTDISNELHAIGAETISINNIRLIDSTIGFDTLPNGQIMVNGVILSAPYTFEAIGDSTTLKQALESANGIIDKMKSSIEDFEYTLDEKDRIEMLKVS